MIIDVQAESGELIWQPNADELPETGVSKFTAFVRNEGVEVTDDYHSLWQWSVDEPECFWQLFADFVNVDLAGDAPVTDGRPMPETRWFPGRRVNFAEHLLQGREGTALISVAEDNSTTEMSWVHLRDQVAAFANYLRRAGVQKGDTVVAVLPNVPEAVVAMLGTVAVGAIWSVCAPEFGPGAITSRFAQLEPKVIVAAPGYFLGGRDRDRTIELQEVLEALPTIERVVWVTDHTGVGPFEVATVNNQWGEIVIATADLEFADTEFSDPLWVLFSSGTTGVPKGIVHGHGGALLETLKMLLIHSDLRPGDRYLNVASTSWVLWNSLVAALGVGAVPVLVDGNPTYPSVDRVWEIVSATETAVVGVGAGFIHACAKQGLSPREDHDLKALRCVQVTGSPLSSDGYRWVYQSVGDVWLSSMSGGTDIASIFVGGVPTLPVRVGYIQAPALGVRVESWDESGSPVAETGELVVVSPMPSMPLFFWGDGDGSRYRSSYFDVYPGVWRHGDFIEFQANGILIHGRSDSTLNRNGLRLGTAEIYAVVEALPEVAEALVIGAEIGSEDYYMPLFVKLADGVAEDEARDSIVRAIRANLSVRYLPDEIIAVRGIPHTRTGKKLEVPVKRLIQGAALDQVVDLGAVDDASIIGEFVQYAVEPSTP